MKKIIIPFLIIGFFIGCDVLTSSEKKIIIKEKPVYYPVYQSYGDCLADVRKFCALERWHCLKDFYSGYCNRKKRECLHFEKQKC